MVTEVSERCVGEMTLQRATRGGGGSASAMRPHDTEGNNLSKKRNDARTLFSCCWPARRRQILNSRTARRREKKVSASIPPQERAETYRLYEMRNVGFSSIFTEVDRWVARRNGDSHQKPFVSVKTGVEKCPAVFVFCGKKCGCDIES